MRQGIAREVWRIDSVGPRNRPLISAGDKPIAELSIAWGNNTEANARLIAAAPELLEACKSALERMEVLIDADEATYLDRKVFVKLEDVISKAEGRD